MHNRADHSVKIGRRDPAPSINPLVNAIGIIVAAIGATAALFVGGSAGVWFGGALLTMLTIWQLFLRHRARQVHSRSVLAEPSRPKDNTWDQAPVLILHVSELGRVRAILGQAGWLPGLKVGAVISDLIRPDQTSLSRPAEQAEVDLEIIRMPALDGAWVFLAPRGEGQQRARDEVMERTSFFAALGHDLKSPLNAIIGFADIMDGEIRGPMPKAYQDYPGLIRESGHTLLRLVEDLLGYARSEAGTYELDIAAMDLAASGESVMRQSQAQAEQAGVHLRFDAPQEVLALADADAVRRIWDNLVSNAIKYSSTGDTVTMSAFQRGPACWLQVRDTGAGMDADDLARIAKPFAQGRNAKGRAGTGLGLAMVHRLAELQSGTVKIETALGTGTTVTITLPSAANVAKRAAE